MSYPFPMREVIADGVIHLAGLAAAFIGSALLVIAAAQSSELPNLAAIGVYALFLLVALIASAAYHMLPWEAPRPWLHKIDHAAIYFKIAGTYTPFVVLIGSAFAYSVLGLIWLFALGGAVAKLSVWRTDGRGSLALYLAMGWACLLLLPNMFTALPGASTAFIILGGLLYTAGTVFFSWRDLPYQNAIWHAFVLAASACFFGAIALTVGHTPS